MLVVVFCVSISVGTLLLKLPIAANGSIGWIDALFIATSAMTVTGLAVVDIGTTFTVFGQFIIALLVQLGGLGIMSFAVLIYIVLGRRIGIKERLLMQHALNQTSVGGIIKLVKYLFLFYFSIEFFAMMILSIRWVPELGLWKGLFYSGFHAISAFNNAGFSLFSDGLIGYRADPLINLTISILFIIGGIGFTVLVDIWSKNSWKRLSLHTKLMLWGSLILNAAAMLFIFAAEYTNPLTLGTLPLGEKLWASYFQAVSPRTAGFNTLDIASMDEATLFFIIVLMFIGAGSASTGGGIKLTTALVILLATLTFLRGKNEISILRRSIHSSIVMKALAISMVSIVFVIFALLILNLTEAQSFMSILFEVVSAFGTVGLSMGITGSLTAVGKILIIFIMFLGKVGPLTLLFTLAKPAKEKYSYPKEDILTG
nr:TrkH family potassium uptake protein [Metabacillus lacus]